MPSLRIFICVKSFEEEVSSDTLNFVEAVAAALHRRGYEVELSSRIPKMNYQDLRRRAARSNLVLLHVEEQSDYVLTALNACIVEEVPVIGFCRVWQTEDPAFSDVQLILKLTDVVTDLKDVQLLDRMVGSEARVFSLQPIRRTK